MGNVNTEESVAGERSAAPRPGRDGARHDTDTSTTAPSPSCSPVADADDARRSATSRSSSPARPTRRDDDVAVASIDTRREPHRARRPARYLTSDELRWAGETRSARSPTAFASKVVGQARLQETLLIALLTGGHVLLESVPGLAKTTAAQTIAQAVGGSVPPHPVHARPAAERHRRHAGLQPGSPAPSRPSSVRCTPTSCCSTRSTAAAPRPSRRCSRRCRSGRPRSATRATRCPTRSSSSPPRTPSSRRAPTRCPRRRWTGSCSRTSSTTRRRRRRPRCCGASTPASSSRASEPGRRHRRRQAPAGARRARLRRPGHRQLHRRHRLRHAPPARLHRAAPGRATSTSAPARARASPSRAAARARALIDGRNHVVPDDVKALTHRVLRHRVTLGFEAAADEVPVESIIDAMVGGIRTP